MQINLLHNILLMDWCQFYLNIPQLKSFLNLNCCLCTLAKCFCRYNFCLFLGDDEQAISVLICRRIVFGCFSARRPGVAFARAVWDEWDEMKCFLSWGDIVYESTDIARTHDLRVAVGRFATSNPPHDLVTFLWPEASRQHCVRGILVLSLECDAVLTLGHSGSVRTKPNLSWQC